MPSLGPSAFERSLAALDPGAFVRFVATLEAAREGVAVDRDGGVLVVRGAETRRVLPLAARRGPLRSPAPTGPVAGPVDEVVAQVDGEAARALATRRDARYRSPANLRDLALYGLDRPVGERLLAEHLGDGPGDATPSRRSAVGVVLLATVVVVAGIAAGAFGGVTSESGRTAPAGNAGTVTATPGASTSDRATAYPPGLNASGVTDADELARAHRDVVADRPYRWVVVAGRTGATWGGRIDVRAVGPERVLRSIAGRPTGGSAEGAFKTYAGENYTYIGIVGPNGTQYSRETVRYRPGGEDRFATYAERYVARYLAAPAGTVTRVEAADTTVYLVRVAGAPARVNGVVSNYTATAVVTPEGFVVSLDVAYTRHVDGDPRAVAFRFSYAPYRDDARPRWYDAAQRVANGTVPPAPGGDPAAPEGSDPRPR